MLTSLDDKATYSELTDILLFCHKKKYFPLGLVYENCKKSLILLEGNP